MSPIFVRPVREQLEHDRLIRFLQTKYKRKAAEIGINPGDEQTAPVKLGPATFFPDLVLGDGRKLVGLVEVESGESVNNLEAMAQWVHFAKAKVPFHLYVPMQSFEVARRLCDAYGARVSELWTYRPTHDGFDLVRMLHDPSAAGSAPVTGGSGAKAGAKAGTSAKSPVKKAAAAKAAPKKAPAKAAANKPVAKKAAPAKGSGRKTAARPARPTPAAKARKAARKR